MSRDAIVGALLGTAVGDALGLPYEALSKRRGVRLLGEPTCHRFVFGHGMVSDDTEHACMVAQALVASAGDPERFARKLAWGMRWWLLGLPAGIGFATLRACIKLWLGFGPEHSGVRSAGNGPAMRAPLIGAAAADLAQLASLVGPCTRITHTDPRALHSAHAVALAAFMAKDGAVVTPADYIEGLRGAISGEGAAELLDLVERAARSAAAGESTETYAACMQLGRGITGYAYHTVPACLHAWFLHPRDFRAAVAGIIRCGGDADTTAAVVGGIMGAAVGRGGIPVEWLKFFEWPRTLEWMERLAALAAEALANKVPRPAPSLFAPVLLARNLVFLAIVFVHVGRRVLPPY